MCIRDRAKAFEAIVKGIDIPTPRVPESFKVLMKELASLGLNIIPIGATVAKEPLANLPTDSSEESKAEAIKEGSKAASEAAKELQEELGGTSHE